MNTPALNWKRMNNFHYAYCRWENPSCPVTSQVCHQVSYEKNCCFSANRQIQAQLFSLKILKICTRKNTKTLKWDTENVFVMAMWCITGHRSKENARHVFNCFSSAKQQWFVMLLLITKNKLSTHQTVWCLSFPTNLWGFKGWKENKRLIYSVTKRALLRPAWSRISRKQRHSKKEKYYYSFTTVNSEYCIRFKVIHGFENHA